MSDQDNAENEKNPTFHQQGQTVTGKQYNLGRLQAENIHLGDNYYQTAPSEVTYPISNLPPANPKFVGRDPQLQSLTGAGPGSATTITQAITGLGGVGKSQLMLHFAYQHHENYDIIWWLRTDEALAEDIIALGRQLALEVATLKEQAAAVQLVRNWLNSTDKRWLLLFDNADKLEPRDLRPYLPVNKNGRILITSRNPHWQGVGQVLRLDVFTEPEAADFWSERLGGAAKPGEPKVRTELAAELGHLPLALEHAAAYIITRHKDPAAYLALYRARRQDLWQRTPPPDDYRATLTTTWEIGFEEAKKTPGAAELLNLCCFLAPDDIPLSLIMECADIMPEELAKILADELALDDALLTLGRYSLLAQTSDGLLGVHRLVQVVARDRMGEERARKWVETAVDFLYKAYPFERHNVSTWAAAGRLIPHLEAVTGFAEELAHFTNRAAYLNNQAGYYLWQYGNLARAQPYFERALAIREQLLGVEHPDTAWSLNNLGALLHAMGDLAAARPYYEQALVIREQVLGVEHRDTASSLNNMSELLYSLGDYGAARVYLERALAIRKQVLGAEHPDTAASLNNLGVLLQAMGDLAGAKPYLEQAMTIREKVLGPDHPDTAESCWWWGIILQAEGQPQAAQSYFQRAHDIYHRILGPDHPDTRAVAKYLT